MQKIDFVIAWVDGNDEQHRLKRQQYLGECPAQDAVADTRFASDDEIYFSIASILKYVPYCGNIYIVTDQQRPEFIDDFEKENLCELGQIQIIDHHVLFEGFEECLPTFNSLTIETMLWKIPQLSDYFIYLNDDFFFNGTSELKDFLNADQVKIYGHWQSNAIVKTKFKFRQMLNQYFGKKLQPKYTIAQMLSADMLDFNKYYEIHHRPHLLDKRVFSGFFEKQPDILKAQIQHRFRSAFQFLPVGLANHLKIRINQAELSDDIKIAYLKNANGMVKFLNELKDENIKFGCIQSLDQLDSEHAEQVRNAMIEKLQGYLPHSIISSS
ncbi:Stealth CR1 domain-containing protein [Acinetobacter sp. P8-3-8]|uniref:Stealth CR1 domain-containing protein n=1 Tax=Acinetobacter sp. P8-3-8 TaxID=1029823 RepID=UPI0002485D1E|nr:Stealth CR1 domain-containing protein [Acinetobacter sp. P8-3-8]